MAADRLTVHIELSGGLELLFANVRSFDAEVDAPAATMRDLIATLRDRHIKERPELFCVDGDIRPGILVLINDTDWELEGRLEYALQAGDSVSFVSTLHGG